SRRHDFDLVEHRPERGASADDIVKLVLSLNLVQVERFFATRGLVGARTWKTSKVSIDTFPRRSTLRELELEVTERAGLGARESQHTDAAIGNHQRDTAKGLDARLQKRAGKVRKTR